VQALRPGTYQRIDEEQFFALQLNGPATPASVQANLWCAVEGLGERVPVRLIDGDARAALLKAQGWDKAAAKEPLRFVTLACNRRLTPRPRCSWFMARVWPRPAVWPTATERRYNFQVREPFAASFSCERENAQAACLPIRPMALSFNAPVARKLAEAIRLKSARTASSPCWTATAVPIAMRWSTASPSSRRLPRRPPSPWNCRATSRTRPAARCATRTAFR
jgi:hypothetical protein